MNDLPEVMRGESVNIFADDAKLDKTIKSSEDVRTLQSILGRMLDWSNKWALKLNISKCKVLHVSRQSNPCERKYYMNGDSETKSVSFEKSLRSAH